jgi:hypothetical protein
MLVTNNRTNSPIAKVEYRLSRPCGNLNKNYVQRVININAMYKSPNDCTFTDFDESTIEHSLFYDTLFGDSELNVYSMNGLLP